MAQNSGGASCLTVMHLEDVTLFPSDALFETPCLIDCSTCYELFCYLRMASSMPMFMTLDILRSLDNFQKRSLHIQAQPFVYAADKDKRLEILNERTAAEKKEREEWLAARAAEAEMTKAERSKLQEQLKLIKAEKEKEKLERKQAAKAQRAIEKEKADIEKEEKRLKAIEEAMLKREQQKEKAIEQAKKKAEQRAIQELKREEQVCRTGVL